MAIKKEGKKLPTSWGKQQDISKGLVGVCYYVFGM